MARVKLLDPADPRRKLDRYELIGAIDSGGMATVYLARNAGVAGFQRLVAIKRLHPHLAGEHEFVEMFLDEARLAAAIHHPHVVPILEVGNSDAGYYLVMEYIEGDTLARLFSRSLAAGAAAMPRPVLVRILLDALAGLHAAHDLADGEGRPMNLVHRDCSPQNVLVGVDGASRLTDFGVARASSRIASTRADKLKGKLAYMSPEHARGAAIDRRADLFSMGVLLWEVLARRRLFKAANEAAVLNLVLHEPIPRLTAQDGDISPALAAVAERALERDPARRFQTAAEMADALEHAAEEQDPRGVASPRTVGAYVRGVLGPELSAQRDALRAWLAKVEVVPVEPVDLEPSTRRTEDPGAAATDTATEADSAKADSARAHPTETAAAQTDLAREPPAGGAAQEARENAEAARATRPDRGELDDAPTLPPPPLPKGGVFNETGKFPLVVRKGAKGGLGIPAFHPPPAAYGPHVPRPPQPSPVLRAAPDLRGAPVDDLDPGDAETQLHVKREPVEPGPVPRAPRPMPALFPHPDDEHPGDEATPVGASQTQNGPRPTMSRLPMAVALLVALTVLGGGGVLWAIQDRGGPAAAELGSAAPPGPTGKETSAHLTETATLAPSAAPSVLTPNDLPSEATEPPPASGAGSASAQPAGSFTPVAPPALHGRLPTRASAAPVATFAPVAPSPAPEPPRPASPEPPAPAPKPAPAPPPPDDLANPYR